MRLLSLFVTACLVASCSDPAASYRLSGDTMGTHFTVTVAQAMPPELRLRLQAGIEAELERVENAMSTYLVESDISRFNASDSTDWITVSADTCRAIEIAERVSQLSGGAFDVTVGPLVNLWGFGPDPANFEPPSPAALEAARERVDYRLLHADCDRPALRKDSPGIYVDLSAYAKGFGVDRLAELLESQGVNHYLVEIGGELRTQGRNAGGDEWTIAIETPADASDGVARVLRLTGKAVATSGDYRNFFEYEGKRYSHSIDPRTGSPTTHGLAAVTVIHDSAAEADALATALLVMGPEAGLAQAERMQVAAYFQVRTESGFAGRATPQFLALESAN